DLGGREGRSSPISVLLAPCAVRSGCATADPPALVYPNGGNFELSEILLYRTCDSLGGPQRGPASAVRRLEPRGATPGSARDRNHPDLVSSARRSAGCARALALRPLRLDHDGDDHRPTPQLG